MKTGTPTKSLSLTKGVSSSSRKKDGGILRQVVVFIGAILIGMVLTIAVCSYFDQTGRLTLEGASDNENVVNVASQLRTVESPSTSVSGAGGVKGIGELGELATSKASIDEDSINMSIVRKHSIIPY